MFCSYSLSVCIYSLGVYSYSRSACMLLRRWLCYCDLVVSSCSSYWNFYSREMMYWWV
jgi:hypothetical protein